MKLVLDYVVTHDKPGRRLVVATGCGRVQSEWPYSYKRPPTIQDALWALAALHCGICHEAGMPSKDTAIGDITFNGEVVSPAQRQSGGNAQPVRGPLQPPQTGKRQIPPAVS